MLLWVMRAVFVLVSAGAGYKIAQMPGLDVDVFWAVVISISASVVIIVIEAISSQSPITTISSIIFGLIFGALISILLYQIAQFLIEDTKLIQPIALASTVVFCFLGVAILFKTRDNFKFIIPYVEFRKEEKGLQPLVVDTSAIIDGRIADVCETNMINSPLIIAKFILQELQDIADSPDKLRRNRGRRGLEMLNRLQKNQSIDVEIHDPILPEDEQVDSKLVRLAKSINGNIITNDYNLNKIAQLQGVGVININDLANALKPVILPGEQISIALIRPGDEPEQGVGYLDDGTMVVAEQGKANIGKTITLMVTSVLQTSAGRMVFGRMSTQDEMPPPKRYRRHESSNRRSSARSNSSNKQKNSRAPESETDKGQ